MNNDPAEGQHHPPRARDFAAQLARMRLLLMLGTAAWAAIVLWLAFAALERMDGATAVQAAGVAVVGSVLFSLLWRLWSRQKPLAAACQTLRDAAQVIPAGSGGIWDDPVADTAVLGLVRPDGTVSLSLAQEEDLQALDRAITGEESPLVSTEIQVLGRAPVAWRIVHADPTASRGHIEPPARRSLADMVKLVALQHRTGVMTPSADELNTVARLISATEPVIIPGGRT